MKNVQNFEDFSLNEEDSEYMTKWLQLPGVKAHIKKIEEIIRETLHPGTDKGSTQAMVDTRDFKALAIKMIQFFKKEGLV
jgi:predicted metal-dependent HD superfamily phosphohydrolase